MTPRTPTPASPPWHPRPSKQSRASRTRTRRKLRLKPQLQTRPLPWSPQIPRSSRKRRRSPHPSSNPCPPSACGQIPRTGTGFGTRSGPNPRTRSTDHPRGLPHRFRNRGLLPPPASAPAVDLISPTAPITSALSASTTGSPASAVPSRPRETSELSLRYTQAGERREVAVRIRRNTTGGLGSTWAIDKVEEPEQ